MFVSLVKSSSSIAVISCDAPIIVNAEELPAGPYNFSTVVNINCKTGYNTVDGAESYELECGSDGTWCKNVSCIRK